MRAAAPAILGALLLLPRPVRAGADIEVPILVLEDVASEESETREDLDVANIVLAATKGVITVQQAPAIITVLTSDELRSRQLPSVAEALELVPGWLRQGGNHNQWIMPMARGTQQGMLLVEDGLALFDPWANVYALRQVPMEMIRRIEVVTGPGGVLWGANSFLGVISIITKDAENVDGVEAGLGYGDGAGSPDDLRGYVMAGQPNVGGVSGLDLLAHTSFEWYRAPLYEAPYFLYHSAQPQPNSKAIYGPWDSADPSRSLILNLRAKLSYRSFRVQVSVPYVRLSHSQTFAGGLLKEDLPQDALAECQPVSPDDPSVAAPPCIDRNRAARLNQHRFADRYVTASWTPRVGEDRLRLNLRAYGVQFQRAFDPLQILLPVQGLLEGGVAFRADSTNYRVGGSLDGELRFWSFRLLAGGEAFREWMPDSIDRSRQGPGSEATFVGPYKLDKLVMPCPRRATWDPVARVPTNVSLEPGCPLTFSFEANRTVLAAYGSLQWRLGEALLLDGGLRVQRAPEELSTRPYDRQILGSGNVVYTFLPRWNLKVGYTMGFRPPVFNNTDSNGEAIEIKGRPDLVPEESRAIQAELNTRVPGGRQLREIDLRLDYSYTWLKGLILFPYGQYENLGTRGIHSAELLAKAYLKGGHRVEVGWTWFQATTEDLGAFRTMPQMWFNIGMVGSFLKGKVEPTATVSVLGAFEDPNRRVEASELVAGPDGVISVDPASGQSVVVQPHELVMDRIPPGAELLVGVRVRPWPGTEVTATAYNALAARHHQPDPVHSYSPRLDLIPQPYEDFRFFTTVSVHR